jgi:acyl-CoA thioesterase I
VTTIDALLSGPDPVRWLFTGDSITHGAAHTNGGRDYVQLFEERVRWELGRRRDHVLRTAISGRRITDLADDLEWSVLQYRPHVVVLMFGFNDAMSDDVEGFATVYLDVVRRIQDAGAIVVVQTTNRMPPHEFPERIRNVPSYAAASRAVAAETGAVLVDHDEAWRPAAEAGLVEPWSSAGCHPNAEGHRVLYRTLARTLGVWDPASPTGRLFVPHPELLA